MDLVFDSQFRLVRDAFARRGIEVEVAYRPNGDVDYVYQVGRLLTVDDDAEENLRSLRDVLPGAREAAEGEQRRRRARAGEPVVVDIGALDRGRTSVPEALDLLDAALREANPARVARNEPPLYAPVTVLHTARLCSPNEPQVPHGAPPAPWPYRPAAEGPDKLGRPVRVAVCDTGLVAGAAAEHDWLAGVTGDDDELGPVLPSGNRLIPAYCGHGTFVAGVVRAIAPAAEVRVADHFSSSGAELEHVIVAKLEQLVEEFEPDVVNLSAGTYSRNDWATPGFATFAERHPDVVLVAAAGNDATARPMWPAAFGWAVSVGSLGGDERHLSWFSNFGRTVDLYTVGEGLVNAYATGDYEYGEPPRRPATQTFTGLALWDGTSFSAPIVAGMIADRMRRTGESSQEAAAAVKAAAAANPVDGRPALLHDAVV